MAWYVFHQRRRLSIAWESKIIWSKEKWIILFASSDVPDVHPFDPSVRENCAPLGVIDCQVMLPQEIEVLVWNCFLSICHYMSVQSDPSTNDTVYWCLLAFVSINHMENITFWCKDMKLVSLSRCQRHPRSNAWREAMKGGSEAKIGILFRRIGSNTKCPHFSGSHFGWKVHIQEQKSFLDIECIVLRCFIWNSHWWCQWQRLRH